MIKEKILVVDDEEDLRNLVKMTLEMGEFEVVTASDGEEALEKLYREKPSLIILDLSLPKIDGYEVCKRIRADVLYTYLPIIMLTSKVKVEDKLKGLNLGTDEYVTKPFEPMELLARVKSLIRRTRSGLSANPLTQLPGNVAIERVIDDVIRKNIPFAVLYLDLNNFKAYNDYYGYHKGDEVIRTTARIIIKVVKELGNKFDFIGHIGGDDFIVVTTPDKVDMICSNIIEKFDLQIPYLYEKEEKQKGYIVTMDRQNKKVKFSFISVAIGVVTNRLRKFSHSGEISSLGTELKKYAKMKGKSAYVVDKRKE